MSKIYVLDTNVLIQAPYAIECFEENEVVLPMIVLEELDNQKKVEGEKGVNIRTAIRKLELYRNKGDLIQGVETSGGGTLRVEKNFINVELSQDLPEYKSDNRILKVCVGLAEKREEQVVLVTKDILLRIKAELLSLNNLGYCLYKQKKYREALVIFEKCLREKRDLSCAANNYVRVLIALGRNKDAKAFIRSSDVKVSKQLKDKVSKLDNHNARLKKDFIAESQSLNEEESTEKASLNIEVKRHQFTNEKLLEDELAAKIENGIPVFGLKLKMYKRKGEYGRQYIIPIGRLDLLCEDCEGNLYIIELKKDSGYDDAYKQTADYKKVHSDRRMKLFEYQISYIER